MKIKVRYFGQLQEVTGKSEEHFELTLDTTASLRRFLKTLYPELGTMNVKIAQDNKITSDSSPLKGQLIDLLPPFSGG